MSSNSNIKHENLIKERKSLSLSFKKGDSVYVLTGSSRGKTGEVMTVLKSKRSVIIRGVNLKKKVVKKSDGSKSFETLEFPVDISNVISVEAKRLKSEKRSAKITAKSSVSYVDNPVVV